jgi:hypothetical protein
MNNDHELSQFAQQSKALIKWFEFWSNPTYGVGPPLLLLIWIFFQITDLMMIQIRFSDLNPSQIRISNHNV